MNYILVVFLLATAPTVSSTEVFTLQDCKQQADAVQLDADHQGVVVCLHERDGQIVYGRYAK